MSKYERNIQQVRDRGESAEMYFLKYGMLETIELYQVFKRAFKEYEKLGYITDETKKMFYDESPDVLNIITYFVILFDIDIDLIENIAAYKLDRGYERGKKNEM